MSDLVRSIRKSFRDKEYRHSYVDDFLNASIATQIKVLREQREWDQRTLADKAGMLQPRISVLENINYSSWSIKTLRKIAEAFDLSLCVSFESFGKRAKDIERFGRQELERDSFKDDPYFNESKELDLDKAKEALKAPEQNNILIAYYDINKKDQHTKPKTVIPYEQQTVNQQHISCGGIR